MLGTRIALAAALTSLAALLTVSTPVFAKPVSISGSVDHDVTFTVHFDDDICGLRSNWTTFNRKVEQWKFIERPDGSWLYRDVVAVTYTSDYDDPALPDLEGRLTEVNLLTLTPGQTEVIVTTYHDFVGDIKIWVRTHLTVVDGQPVVEFVVEDVIGCP